MFLVIFAHLAPLPKYANIWIYSFHMPFFFFISGFLTKHSTNLTITTKKYTNKLIVPAIFFSILFILVMSIPYQFKWFDIIQDSEGNLETKGSLFETVLCMLVYNAKAFVYSGKMSAVTVWFLFALFYCHIMHTIKLIIGEKLFLLLFILCLTTIFICELPCYISQGFIGYIFYYCGTKINVVNNIIKLKFSLYLPVIVLVPVIIFLNGSFSIFDFIIGKFTPPINLLLSTINGLIGCFLLIKICTYIPHNHFVSDISKSLITSLGAQFIFIYTYKYTLHYGHNYLFTSIFAITILFSCYLLHKLLTVLFPYFIGVKPINKKT